MNVEMISCKNAQNSSFIFELLIFVEFLKRNGDIDPLGQLKVTAVFAHVVRSYVRPHSSKQNKFQAKTMFTTGKTVGLVEWIMMPPVLVFFSFVVIVVHCTFLIFPALVTSV